MSIPYEMFQQERTDKEFRAAKILEGIYHKGQNKSWDGKQVFKECLKKKKEIDQDKLNALGNIFNVILWGELAAWKISARLADEIESVEAKMAVTSQTFDEAKHFFVMVDYLKEINFQPTKINKATETILNKVLQTNSLAKKLLGMHLMIEPVAITIFKYVRESDTDPTLSELLSFYEQDEARHIGIAVNYLPEIINKMSMIKKIDLLIFQIKLLFLEVDGLRSLKKDFDVLNINTNSVFKYAEKKQLESLILLLNEVGINKEVWNPIVRVMNYHKKVAFTEKLGYSAIYNIFRNLLVLI